MTLPPFFTTGLELVRGSFLAALLGFSGLFFCTKLRFFFLKHPGIIFRETVGELFRKNKARSTRSSFGALCVALGGTVGVGNTVGVAIAISDGGAGALFWMWVAALCGMGLKYAEVYLALRFKNETTGFGGAMVLLREKLSKKGLSVIFCICCLMASFGMGNLAQSSAASASFTAISEIPPLFFGIFIALLCLLIFSGGMRRITAVSTLCVPVMSLVFFLLCLLTLCKNASFLPEAGVRIFRDAFSLRAAAGGAAGTLFARALSTGFCRGLFSNEAGLGSTPLVHATAQSSPEKQGLWGAFEVFCDTLFICTLSGLCILSSPVYLAGGETGASLCSRVFEEALGKPGAVLFGVTTIFFAAASILAWGGFGGRALSYLTRRKLPLFLYYAAFFAATVFGAVGEPDALLLFSDVANVLMALPNLYALFALRRFLKAP